MAKEGIVLGHKVSGAGIEVDKAKINIISKLPPPTNIKGIRSFLGHASFYRRFIKDFSKIARPLIKLLEKDTPFEVWNHLKPYMRVSNMPSTLDLIVDSLEPMFNKKSARSIIVKPFFAASCYLIWKEYNDRLFAQNKSTPDQVIESNKSTVHLKLLSCRFKKTENVQRLLRLGKVPSSLISPYL
ncbi:hypothetical protein Tco_1243476 [Tanacetum coccineum]